MTNTNFVFRIMFDVLIYNFDLSKKVVGQSSTYFPCLSSSVKVQFLRGINVRFAVTFCNSNRL